MIARSRPWLPPLSTWPVDIPSRIPLGPALGSWLGCQGKTWETRTGNWVSLGISFPTQSADIFAKAQALGPWRKPSTPMTTTLANQGSARPAQASKVTGRGQGGKCKGVWVPPARRANPAQFLPNEAGVPATREERHGRGQRAGRRVENEGRAGSRRGADTAQLAHLGTHWRPPAHCRPRAWEGGETMPARRGSPGRTPPPAGHGLLLPGRRATAERRRERLPDRARGPARPVPRPPPRVLHPTSPGGADPPPPPGCRWSPSPCRCPCWCRARRPASGCSWCGGWGGGG